MALRAVLWASLVAAIAFWNNGAPSAWADETNPDALAAALKGATVTLQDGFKASAREGNPISGKFAIDDNALQLSVYTLKGEDVMEVAVDPKTGAIAKAEKITEADDLEEAAGQKSAMAKAATSLLDAADAAVKANPGYRAVSVYPQLQNGNPVAAVTLPRGTTFKKVTEKLG